MGDINWFITLDSQNKVEQVDLDNDEDFKYRDSGLRCERSKGRKKLKRKHVKSNNMTVV